MDLAPYVDELQRQLAIAAEAGGDDSRALAERLSAPLETATRLVLLEALSAAASEITRELAPGSVDVRLRGRDPEFVVANAAPADYSEVKANAPTPAAQASATAAATATDAAATADPAAPDEQGDTSSSRTTLRLPEHIKARVDVAAAEDGLSVNAWLVRAITSALEPKNRRTTQRESRGDQFTGWVR